MSACRVVIADDVVYFRTLLRYALEESHYEVVGEAGDGREAIEAVRKEKPDVIILDLSMPVMDGLQAIPEILELSPATKILVLSGFEALSMAEQAIERGAHSYLEKGVDLDEITVALAKLWPQQ
jgi:YesN/AraC family two-component response regulator